MKKEDLNLQIALENGIHQPDGNVAAGLMWGALISVPLWISILGWISSLT
ncbi:hypothetical protein Q5741_02920 [Paenibacillus sp. JX-17]|uniref:Uncharacterized protein n=1 Tax=Paenibacillus lacisoli TaxID=3064525 RepID=A0ABT9C9V9_9BACL|nr:hypothetical protein [Paenibacillus sp. JX-17]MDO7905363.1 hypothetical protein [Paenibacillus sp. JX-17]